MDRDTDLAKLAYRAHTAVLRTQRGMPPWDELPRAVQTAWEIAAAAVRRNLRKTG